MSLSNIDKKDPAVLYIYRHAQLKLYAYGKKRNNLLKRNVDESEKIE